jgi:hypothetical protein
MRRDVTNAMRSGRGATGWCCGEMLTKKILVFIKTAAARSAHTEIFVWLSIVRSVAEESRFRYPAQVADQG